MIRTIETLPAPVIALVEGGVWGGAVELVLACDMIIATPDTTFAVTPARLGVPYNMSGMMTFMSAASPRIARELAFTARPIDAAQAERVGMINVTPQPTPSSQPPPPARHLAPEVPHATRRTRDPADPTPLVGMRPVKWCSTVSSRSSPA